MITDLRLQHFRSYSDESFELSPGVNIIVGPNGSGKTNLLEAVLVLARGGSYRARDPELVQHGQPWARLDGHSETSGRRTVKFVGNNETAGGLADGNSGNKQTAHNAAANLAREITYDKTYELDGRTFQRLTQAHSLPVVLFEPDHLRLLGGGPERRREYLDDLLEQTTPGYGQTRRDYRRTLAQRNRLLKHPAPVSPAQLFPWNVRLAQLAGVVARARTALAAELNSGITGLYAELSGTGKDTSGGKTARQSAQITQAAPVVTVAYDHRWPPDSYESRFLDWLEAAQADDQQRGFTGRGPHREDLLVSFDGRPAAETASRGEIRTAVLALKIIELQLLQTARAGQTPLLLLDDVFSELDGKRRHALVRHLAPYQTFITTTDADLVLEHFSEACHVIPLG